MVNTSALPPDPHSHDPKHDPKYLIGSLNAILRYNNHSGNVNFFMAVGGTNFGWWQGGASFLVGVLDLEGTWRSGGLLAAS